MEAQITNSLKIETGETFKKSLSELPLYFFIGGVEPWEDESHPPEINHSVADMIQFYGDVSGLKRIHEDNIFNVIKYNPWEEGITYDQYEDHKDLSKKKFYVINDENHVYKCLSNYDNSEAFDQPSGTGMTPMHTKDGYIWKYMYTLTQEHRDNYSETGFIPCYYANKTQCDNQLKVQETASDGAVDLIRILDGGKGYTNEDVIVLRGDGKDFFAKPLVDEHGTIVHICVKNSGINYRTAFAEVDSKTGSGAMLRAVISPIGGHGSNAVEELCATEMMISIEIDGDENGTIPTDISYRKIGVLAKPLSNECGTVLRVTNINKFSSGEVIKSLNTSSMGRIIHVDKDSSLIYIEQISGYFAMGEQIISGEGVCVPNYQKVLNVSQNKSLPLTKNVINNEDYLAYSGKLLWFQNISPVDRSETKTDAFKFIVSF